jgi:hypothetical protein
LINRIIILVGAENSASAILGRNMHSGLKAKLQHEKGSNVFSLDGKNICINSSSCQERNNWSDFERVIDRIEKRLDDAELDRCSLVILPFTLMLKKGELNTDCIVKPLDDLKKTGAKMRLVYLQKSRSRGADLMDGLMLPIADDVIVSDNMGARQTDELWKILIKFDP